MGIKITDEEYILQASKSHNFKYKYLDIFSENGRKYFKIVCPIHGEFVQRTDIHLRKGECLLCTKNGKLTLKYFIEESNKVHNNKYSYDRAVYVNTRTKITITCPIHGDFAQLPQSHLNGFGCSRCSNNIKPSDEEFIEKFSKIHNNKYDYSLVNYGKNNKEKVKIICPIHGIFEQSPRLHLNYGCPKCYNPGYSLEKWIINCNNTKSSKLYIIQCFDEAEDFIKIGITSKTIQDRFRSSLLPYEYKIIKEIDTPPDIAWKEEKSLHKLYKDFKYTPLKSFDGHLECFTKDILPLIENSTDLYPPSDYS